MSGSMRFGSVCSGIEAASVAWHPLGWKAAWLSEIEKFPCALLAHHYPNVPNLGDMTTLPNRIRSGEVEAPDVFCGGTPCQAFSVAGLRKSLDDARGNLSLTFCEIADAIDQVRLIQQSHPSIVFWENVPGVLNTKDNAFGCFLGALAGEDDALIPSGGRWTNAGFIDGPQRAVAWRVLDAQYFGVAQRRRRVFVIASARDDFDPAAVLFEFDGLRRDTAPSREKGKAVAASVGASPIYGGSDANTADTVTSKWAKGSGGPAGNECGLFVAQPIVIDRAAFNQGENAQYKFRAEHSETMDSLVARGPHAVLQPIAFSGQMSNPQTDVDMTQTLQAKNPMAVAVGTDIYNGAITGDVAVPLTNRSDGTGTGPTVMQPIPIHDQATRHAGKNGDKTMGKGNGLGVGHPGEPMNTLTKGDRHAVAQPIGFENSRRDGVRLYDGISNTLQAFAGTGGGNSPMVAQSIGTDLYNGAITGDVVAPLTNRADGTGTGPSVMQSMAVRRLTPVECERLQGFPDNYTKIADKTPDGPRYKALGNSWAVPVVRWIGERIARAT